MTNGIYKHFKGNKYKVIGIIFDATNDQEMILYQPLYDSEYLYFTRTVEDFMSKTEDGTQRFTKV